MADLVLTKTIAAAPESVFEIFADLDRAAERVSGIEKIELLTEGAVGVGTRWRETRIIFKKEAVEELEITAFEPPHGYEVGCESCGCRYTTAFRFTPVGAGTEVTMEMNTKPITFFAKLMMPLGALMMGSMKKCLERDLDDLKTVAESKS